MTDVGARPGDSPATSSTDDPASEDSAPRQTVAIPRPVLPPPAQSTVVIEDGVIPRRLRRPLDLARFLVALAATAATVLIAYFATSTTEGIEEDITGGAALLPSIVILALNIIGGIGLLGLPIAAAVNLVIRRRVRQLFDALVGLLLTVILLTLASYLVETYGSAQLVTALAGSVGGDTSVTAPIIGGLVAFITVARLMSRRPWDVLSVLVVGSLAIVALLSTTATVAGLLISFFVGWGLGLLTRYVVGTPTTRPSGSEVAATMSHAGYPLTVLRASRQTSMGRRYVATTRSGESLEVVVLDRDLEGAGLASAAWKALRLRDESGRGAFNMRRELDHAALMAYAAQAANAPVPRLLLTSEVGADSALLAYDYTIATRFSDLSPEQISDDDLEQAWRAMRTLHDNEIAHRSLTSENILLDREGKVWLVGEASGTVAAGDVAQRIDVAELLCTLALIAGADRAIRTGRKVLGVPGLARALPVLQPVALTPTTRKAMRKNRDLMVHLRDALVEIRPDGEVEQINVERIKPRTLIMIVVGTIAAYVLLSQLAQVDLGELLTSASLEWLAVAVVAALVTYVGAAWSLSGFVPERIPLHRTMLAQVAGDFATLVSPPTLGSVAINMRFLTKAGLHPALAGASVGVSQVAAFVVHLLLLLGFGIAAGTQADFTFDPPAWAVIVVIAVVILFLAAFAVAPLRRYVFGRVRPLLREVIPRLVTVAQRPMKLVEGIGGIVLLNLAYIVVLIACVRAFDGDLNVAAIAFVYLAGATIGQAAPTPGGLGAVEAALAAGLTAAGLPGGIAVSSVLLFRLITFWIPTIPGYAAFNWLTKKGYL
jgi:uncharacterized protein (TIRG00374 family)